MRVKDGSRGRPQERPTVGPRLGGSKTKERGSPTSNFWERRRVDKGEE